MDGLPDRPGRVLAGSLVDHGGAGGRNPDHRGAARVTPEQERLAEALAVFEQHGDRAPVHIAERIGALALAGDAAGAARWQEIAAALDGVLRPPGQA